MLTLAFQQKAPLIIQFKSSSARDSESWLFRLQFISWQQSRFV